MAGGYVIRVDVQHAMVASYITPQALTVQVLIYAGLDAYNIG